MKFFRTTIFLGLCCSTLLTLTSCNKYNYTDDLQSLGLRVEILEQKVLEANMQLEAIQSVIYAIQTNGYITQVVENSDGTFTITFNTGSTYTLRNGRVGKDGRDGRESEFVMGAAQDPEDGIYYWTVNGSWLLDKNGNKVRAGAYDGKDGANGQDGANGRDGVNGKDGKDGVDGQDGKSLPYSTMIPRMRINSNTRNWEISTDGGMTWTDTGFCADGKDGKDGKDGADGKDGKDDFFIGAEMAIIDIEGEPVKVVKFTMSDGKVYYIPIDQ